MKLVSVKEFVEISGVTKQMIYRLLKKGERLAYYHGSNKIDIDSPLAQAYLNNPAAQRGESGLNAPANITQPGKPLEKQITNVQKALEQLTIEKGARERQARIKLELENAVTRGELLKQDLVESSLMMYLDKVHNNLRRMSGSFFDDIARNVQLNSKPLPELKREWTNETEKMIHEAKTEIAKRIVEIGIEQGRGK